MLTKYIEAAMRRAKYEILPDDGTFYGEIPGFEGVYANAGSLEACREELREVLEKWILLRVSRNLSPPILEGIELFPRSYTYKRPHAYIFRERYPVSKFKDILMGLCHRLYQVHGTDFDQVLQLRGPRGATYFSRNLGSMRSPQEIPGSGIYAETNLNANDIMTRCGELLELFGYSPDQLQVE